MTLAACIGGQDGGLTAVARTQYELEGDLQNDSSG